MAPSSWVTLGVPRIGPRLLLIARNVLGIVAAMLLVLWTRGRLAHLTATHCAAAALLGLLTAAADLVVLAERWQWQRNLNRLEPALHPVLRGLHVSSLKLVYATSGLYWAWITVEGAFELLLIPAEQKVFLCSVAAPSGFQLTDETLKDWFSFSRSDSIAAVERERGIDFADRVVSEDLGAVALRAATPVLALERVLQLVVRPANESK